MQRILIGLSALVLAACGPEAPPEPAAPLIQLYAMDCAHLVALDAAMFSDEHVYDGQRRELIVPCYLIRHPAGDLLWDSGMPEAIADMPDGIRPTQVPFHITVPVRLTAQLAQLNLTPADIEFVSFSHSHSDHSGNGNMFTASTWIVDADEREHMFSAAARTGMEYPNYSQLENAQTRLIEGDGDHDVFGDGSVTIVQTPGHTPGHTVLLVRLANAGPILLTGDMYHMAEARERRTVPVFNTDRAQTLASMDKVEALAAATGARLVRQHVWEDFQAMPAFPAALN